MSTKPAVKQPTTPPSAGPGRRVSPTAKVISAGIASALLVVVGLLVVLRPGSPKSSQQSSVRSSKTSKQPAGASDAGRFRFAVGDPGPGLEAPPVVLPASNGETFDLATYRGKGVLLYFQEGIGCQPCWDQMRDYATAAGMFKAVGVDEFVTITSNPVSLLARKMRQDGITGIVLADTDLAVSKTYHANDYGMMGTSTDGHSFVFVDATGIIRWRADYGGSPDFTMYVPPTNLLADLRAGLGLVAAP